MGRINPKSEGFRKDAHLNWMAGRSYDLTDPFVRLRMAASSCFFGEPMYYHRDADDKRKVAAVHTYPGRLDDYTVTHLRETLNAIEPEEWRGKTPAELMESAIDAALDKDPEIVLREAVRLRNEEHMRTTPQVILVRAAMHPKVAGTDLLARFGGDIVSRADEPAVGLAYFIWRYGKPGKKGRPLPSRLKRVWKRALEDFDDYALAKYRMERRAVKTVDVVNLVHPKSDSVNRLVRGELTVKGRTWEGIVSEKGSNKDSWTEALEKMGHMALLRNLRNLIEAKVDPALFKDKLVKGAVTGKQLPFRYYSAYRAIQENSPPSLLDAVEECLLASISNLPHFQGRVMSLCDNSGSAWGNHTSAAGSMAIAQIGNLTSVLTAMASDEGYVGVFGDRLHERAVPKRASVFDQVKLSDRAGQDVGGATENGIWLFWDKAIKKKEHWDSIFVYSDMQAGHGGLYGIDGNQYRDYLWGGRGGAGYRNSHIDVPKLIAAYRSKVNPYVNVFLVQIAGYQDTILPEFFDRTYILGGWGEAIFRFAAAMIDLTQQAPVLNEQASA